MVRTAFLLSAALVLLCLTPSEPSAATVPTPPTPAEFVGVWQGYSEGQLEFARLELDERGSGVLVVSYLPDAPPQLYVVGNWRPRGFSLDIQIRPHQASSESISVSSARMDLASLRVKLKGQTWERNFVLVNDAKLQARANSARSAIQRFQESR